MSATIEAPAVQGQAPTRRRRRRLAGAAAVVVAAVLVAVVAVLTGGDGNGGDRAVPATSSTSAPTPPAAAPAAPSTSEPGPEPEPVDGEPAPGGTDGVPPTMPAAALDQAVEQAGITGSVVSVQAVDGRATGPGDVAGPALMVTLRLVNGTAEALSLDAVSVNLSTGEARAPASPLGDPRRAPFTGTLSAGGSAEGVYVFRAATGDRDRVDVEVGYRPGQAIAVFSGAVR